MASRGSVIPLFVDQIRKGLPLTVTDPCMTRFMMSLDDAVDLVLYAFQNGCPGDLFVQKAPAATIGTLAEAVRQILGATNSIHVIGTRHGEKLYETLLTREEMVRAMDLGNYFRVPADVRDLNYAKYFSEGESQLAELQDYHSHNTARLNTELMVELLMKLPYIQEELARDAAMNGKRVGEQEPASQWKGQK
jgi:UDP-glucose 4-epimerase